MDTAQPSGTSCRRLRMSMAFLVVVGLTLLLYSPTVGFSFLHFDDGYYVFDNPFVPQGVTWYGLVRAFALDNVTYWHPLTWLSLMADAQLFGLNPAAFHLHNAALHAASAGLLFLALAKMTGRTLESLLASIIFAVHPLNIESVAWVAERKSVLSTLFFMLCLLAYAAHARRPSGPRLGVVLVAMALGLLAKPTLVVLPALLLLLDWWPLARFPRVPEDNPGTEPCFPKTSVRTLLLEKLSMLILAGAVTAIVVASREDVSLGGDVADSLPLGLRLANFPVALLKYLAKFLFPQDLAIFYPFPESVPALLWVGSLALVAALTVAALWSSWRKPEIAVGWLWFLVCLAPMSGIVQAGLWPGLADRFAYLPMIGLCLILCMGMRGLVPRWGRHGHLAMGGVLAAYFIFFTWIQLPYWANGVVLFERAASLYPMSYIIHNNLATALLREGEVEAALGQLDDSLQIRSDTPWPHRIRGLILRKLGRAAEAEAEFRKALALRPDLPEPMVNLAGVMVAQGHYSEAEVLYLQALQIQPDHPGANASMGKLLLSQGRWVEAEAAFRRVLAASPHDLGIRTWLARCLDRQGRDGDAWEMSQSVLADDPGFSRALRLQADILESRGEVEAGANAREKARSSDEHYAKAFAEIGRAALAAGKLDSAVYHSLQAVEIAPWSDEYAEGLSAALRAAGRGGEALDVLVMARGNGVEPVADR